MSGADPREDPETWIASLITEALPGATCTVSDLTGTRDHWKLEVEWDGFADLSILEQHRRVLEVLRPYMSEGDDSIHAVQIATRVPENQP